MHKSKVPVPFPVKGPVYPVRSTLATVPHRFVLPLLPPHNHHCPYEALEAARIAIKLVISVTGPLSRMPIW